MDSTDVPHTGKRTEGSGAPRRTAASNREIDRETNDIGCAPGLWIVSHLQSHLRTCVRSSRITRTMTQK
jgi:hypothetical protein